MNCNHCQDTMRIRGWREYMSAWRERVEIVRKASGIRPDLWMLGVDWKELIQTCRELRDYNRLPKWKERRGGFEHDCPMCMF